MRIIYFNCLVLSSGNTFTTPILTQNTSYFVEINENGCASERSEIFILVQSTNASFSTNCNTQRKPSRSFLPMVDQWNRDKRTDATRENNERIGFA